mgnify:CR=1 FL=1|uniref:Hydroxyacid dehydrogenase n=1 Tax=candidate division WOR-3 bacterium TaxID=2052148 RepID=A0A7C3N643_UNCW3
MKILITGAFKINKEQEKLLKKFGYSLYFHKDEKKKISPKFYDVDGVICNSLFLYNNIKDFKNIKFIQLTSAGFDRVPIDYIKKKRIKIFNAKGVYSVPISEWVVLRILEIYKKTREFEKLQKQHKWEKIRDIEELTGKVVGILGFGDIGKEIAKRLKPFGVKIFVCDIRDVKDKLIEKRYNTENIYEFLKNIDILVISLPLTEKTKGLLDYKKLKIMKKDSILINISRGEVIKEKDLIRILKGKKFKGVYLDVFENEPLPSDSPLWDFENVYITPHNSFISDKVNDRLFKLIVKNLRSL